MKSYFVFYTVSFMRQSHKYISDFSTISFFKTWDLYKRPPDSNSVENTAMLILVTVLLFLCIRVNTWKDTCMPYTKGSDGIEEANEYLSAEDSGKS